MVLAALQKKAAEQKNPGMSTVYPLWGVWDLHPSCAATIVSATTPCMLCDCHRKVGYTKYLIIFPFWATFKVRIGRRCPFPFPLPESIL